MRRVLALTAAIVALGACGGAAETASTSATTGPSTTAAVVATTEKSSTTTAAAERSSSTVDTRAGCTKVEDPTLLDAIKNPEAWSAKAPRGAWASRNEQAWYVATADGALWVTNIQPDATDDGGLTLPMNQTARADSDVGADVAPGAPAYEGLKLSDPGAVSALSCARA